VQDILEEMGSSLGRPANANYPLVRSQPPSEAFGTLDEDSALLQALGFDPVSLDALQARTGMDTPSLQAELMTLELDGHVARLPGGLFQRMGSS
jgi:DNA processing protein